MKHKNKILFSFLIIGAISVTLSTNLKENEYKSAEVQEKLNNLNLKRRTPQNKLKRSVASIPSTNKPKIALAKRIHIGDQTRNLKNLTIINTYNDKWETKFKTHFSSSLPGKELPKAFKIKKLKSVIMTKNNSSKLMEHILVSFIKKNGSHFSFEAMVNSTTGMVHKSWNQTRFEKNHFPGLPASGQEFRQ